MRGSRLQIRLSEPGSLNCPGMSGWNGSIGGCGSGGVSGRVRAAAETQGGLRDRLLAKKVDHRVHPECVVEVVGSVQEGLRDVGRTPVAGLVKKNSAGAEGWDCQQPLNERRAAPAVDRLVENAGYGVLLAATASERNRSRLRWIVRLWGS